MRRLRLLLPAIAALLLAGVPAASFGQETSLTDLEDEVMCPTCGVTLALSEAPQANQIRDQIRGWISEGLTKDEIKDELVTEYGEEVLATPSASGFDLAAWVVPILALVAAAIAIAVGARRWRARAGDPQAQPTPSLPDDDAQRLETDLGRYEL